MTGDDLGFAQSATLLCLDHLCAALRLGVWLESLGNKAPEVLSTLMDLLAQGVIKPHSGAPLPHARNMHERAQNAARYMLCTSDPHRSQAASA